MYGSVTNFWEVLAFLYELYFLGIANKLLHKNNSSRILLRYCYQIIFYVICFNKHRVGISFYDVSITLLSLTLKFLILCVSLLKGFMDEVVLIQRLCFRYVKISLFRQILLFGCIFLYVYCFCYYIQKGSIYKDL